MQIKIVDDQFDHLKWNNYATHPLQAWEWGEARKEMGIKVVRIMETDQVNLNNVYQLTIHQIPKTSFYIGYVPRSVIPSLKAMDFFRSYAKKNRIIFIKFEPNIENIGNNKKMLVKSPHPLFPTWTQVIDLQKNENILLMQMKPKTRYNIKLAQKKGVIVREISDDKGFSIFIKLYFETCKRQKYFGHDYNYHKIVWKNLKNGIAHILIAFLNDLPLASYELFHFKEYLYYPYGGTSTQYRNYMASNLLMWESIRFGKKMQLKKFDMWGSLAPDFSTSHHDSSWAGFTRFKEGYGGKYVELTGSYDLVINNKLYQIYNHLNEARKIFLRIKRLI